MASSIFLKWLRRPLRTGAIAPSSPKLARMMVAHADLARPGAVVELGAGTGAITRAIVESGVPRERLYAFEFDSELAAHLRRRFPGINVVEGDAGEAAALLKSLGVTRAAAVLSGLPLLSMPPDLQFRILDNAFHLLGEGGRFIQFTYGPASPVGPALRRALRLKARRGGRVLMNMPPARVWCYEREADRNGSVVSPHG